MSNIRIRLLVVGFALLWLAPAPTVSAAGAQGESALRAVFEQHYAAFKAHCERVASSSLWSVRLDSPDYRGIVAMGVPALPLIVEKLSREPGFHWISSASTEIACVVRDPEVYPWAAQERTLTWWEGGQKLANERFNWAYGQWKAAKAEGRPADEEKFLKTMDAIGIAALPPMTEKIAAGEVELLPIVQALTDGKADTAGATDDERIASCLSWWEANKKDWLIPFPDQQMPTAAANPGPTDPPEPLAIRPLRELCEPAGASVYWIEDANAAVVAYDSKAAWFQAGNPVAVLDGVETQLALPPYVLDGRMMVPAGAVAEWLNHALTASRIATAPQAPQARVTSAEPPA